MDKITIENDGAVSLRLGDGYYLEAYIGEDNTVYIYHLYSPKGKSRFPIPPLALFAWAKAGCPEPSAPKPKAPKTVRCIECEHLDMGTVKNGRGYCTRNCTNLEIYAGWGGYPDSTCFTRAALGCGSPEQALRAELIRLHDKKES